MDNWSLSLDLFGQDESYNGSWFFDRRLGSSPIRRRRISSDLEFSSRDWWQSMPHIENRPPPLTWSWLHESNDGGSWVSIHWRSRFPQMWQTRFNYLVSFIILKNIKGIMVLIFLNLGGTYIDEFRRFFRCHHVCVHKYTIILLRIPSIISWLFWSNLRECQMSRID